MSGISKPTTAVSRRSLLRAGALTVAAPAAFSLIGCSMDDRNSSPTSTRSAPGASGPVSSAPGRSGASGQRVLLAHSSRAGENDDDGGRTTLSVGNTKVLAQMISELIDCDTFRIQAADPYPDGYDDTVARNVCEQDADARPAIAGSLPDLDDDDVVLLGGPIWNVRPPMIMQTFTDALDVTDERVAPFVTCAVSGLGNTHDVYPRACRSAELTRGLAVRGEDVAGTRPAARTWLRRTGLLTA